MKLQRLVQQFQKISGNEVKLSQKIQKQQQK